MVETPGTRSALVAVGDELGITAQGIGVIHRSTLVTDLRRLEELLESYPPRLFVVGLPLNMNGTLGPQARKVQSFAEVLGNHFGLPVDVWDERLSTVAAGRVLGETSMSRAKRQRVIDKVAAVLILQGYMDHRRSTS